MTGKEQLEPKLGGPAQAPRETASIAPENDGTYGKLLAEVKTYDQRAYETRIEVVARLAPWRIILL